jgi:multidrug resistance efflux pump
MKGPISAPTNQLTSNGTPPATPPQRQFKRSTRIALITIVILPLLAGGGFAASYVLNARNYVTTDNAQVNGDKMQINAPTSGTLQDWRITQGDSVHENEIVGRVKIFGGFAQPLMNIRAPGDGTVATDNGVPGTFVTTGTPLAVAYNLNKIYVTARVDETDIKAVHPGQVVDIDVDAYPHTRLTGRVQEVQGGAAAAFSLFPQSNSSGNFQKVTQVIPVKIELENIPYNIDLVPGMNVTVHIHKR